MFNIHVIYVKLDTEIKGWLFDFSVKVFELEVNSVNQSLMTGSRLPTGECLSWRKKK